MKERRKNLLKEERKKPDENEGEEKTKPTENEGEKKLIEKD